MTTTVGAHPAVRAQPPRRHGPRHWSAERSLVPATGAPSAVSSRHWSAKRILVSTLGGLPIVIFMIGAIIAMETGAYAPSVYLAIKVAPALGTTVETLWAAPG